jgi:glucose uptake protein GlcU
MGLKVRVFIYKFIGAWLLLGSLGGVMTVVSGDSDPGPLVTGMDLLLAVAFGVLGYKAWRAGSGLIMRGRANVAAERVRQTPRPPES